MGAGSSDVVVVSKAVEVCSLVVVAADVSRMDVSAVPMVVAPAEVTASDNVSEAAMVTSVVSMLVEPAEVEASVAVVLTAVVVSDSTSVEVPVARVSTVEVADPASVLETSATEEEKVAETADEPILSQLTHIPKEIVIRGHYTRSHRLAWAGSHKPKS